MKNFKLTLASLSLFGVIALTSCEENKSTATGWDYNKSSNGGTERVPYLEQEIGPGLVFIEGGVYKMGRTEDDLNYSGDNLQAPVTVSSFLMDETEVTNQHWLDYLHWLNIVYQGEFPEMVGRALPDTNCWRKVDEDMEKYVELYLRHPAYQDYPVVGVSWLQASDYCAWRTDRVNEQILVREGIIVHNLAPDGAQLGTEHFTTETYFSGQYDGEPKDASKAGITHIYDDGWLFPKKSTTVRRIRMEDGILLPRYRLPTEAEWEYAAMALIGNSYQELITDRRTYPWNGHYVRNGQDDNLGDMRANFMRGAGDAMGVAGYLNDRADITAPVYEYPPNDFGLYNMAGNVSEWVADVYRPLTEDDRSGFRAFRGNVYNTKVVGTNGLAVSKITQDVFDIKGVKLYLDSLKNKRLVARTKYSANDLALIDKCITTVDEALVKLNERDETGAMDLMRIKVLPDVKASNADIAYTILDNLENYIIGSPGRQKMRNVTLEENINRTNYRKADNIDHHDGDFLSSNKYGKVSWEDNTDRMYDYGKTTLINNRSRVYKGGSWEDRVYYNVPSTRRFLDERRSSRSIGFRCAMDWAGRNTGLGARGRD
jgi:gliding motility-associated lipoprotein GldJ